MHVYCGGDRTYVIGVSRYTDIDDNRDILQLNIHVV